jgi:probable HAF family extracellular repeat protein
VHWIGGRYARALRSLLALAVALAFGAFAGSSGAAPSPFTAIDLGTLGGSASFAYGLNASGEVVGESQTASGAWHAFSWTADGGMVDLGSLGGTTSAHAVNDSGQVVGEGFTASLSLDAFSWTPQGGMVDIPGPNGNQNHALAVNDAGQVLLGPGTGGGRSGPPPGQPPS